MYALPLSKMHRQTVINEPVYKGQVRYKFPTKITLKLHSTRPVHLQLQRSKPYITDINHFWEWLDFDFDRKVR
jgi:hypothetical protein